jgi:DNA-binding response OmpR family regulator
MRLLVIEDDANIAAAFKEGPGYAIDVTYDGEEGARLAETSEYDLIVLDLMLPKNQR